METEFREVWQQPRHLVRRLHPDDRAAPHTRRCEALAQRSHRRRRHLRGRRTRAGTASPARRSSRRRTSSTGCVRSTRRKPEWIKENELLLPAVRRIATGCSRTTTRIRSSSSPTSGATRSCGSSRAGWTISPSAAPASRGAFRCRSTRASVVYVWFDALINYVAAVGYGTDPATVRAVVAGRPARDRQGHHAVPLRRSGRRC